MRGTQGVGGPGVAHRHTGGVAGQGRREGFGAGGLQRVPVLAGHGGRLLAAQHQGQRRTGSALVGAERGAELGHRVSHDHQAGAFQFAAYLGVEAVPEAAQAGFAGLGRQGKACRVERLPGKVHLLEHAVVGAVAPLAVEVHGEAAPGRLQKSGTRHRVDEVGVGVALKKDAAQKGFALFGVEGVVAQHGEQHVGGKLAGRVRGEYEQVVTVRHGPRLEHSRPGHGTTAPGATPPRRPPR